MKPGTLLKIYQHLKRIGISADVSATEDQVTIRITIRTREMTALYDMDEIMHLVQQAPTWK